MTSGFDIHHRWAGRDSGPVLALSHPLGASHETWQPQLDALGRHYRLLLWDHRGHGRSQMPPEPWTISDFGRDFLMLLERVGLRTVHFCGLSLGGMVGQWVTLHSPERIGRLILANTAARIGDSTLLRDRIAHVEREGVTAIADNVLDRWFTPEFRSGHPEEVARIRELFLQASPAGYAAASRAICAMDLRERLPEIRVPTLVIVGTRDQATPPAWGRRIAETIPGARLAELEAAHLSNVEVAASFDSAVLDFLGA